MATLKDSLQSKVDTLGVGVIQHLHSYLPASLLTNDGNTLSAQVILKEPKIYKSLFCLDNLGIDKTLRSVVIEVKDSRLTFYYLLDSYCFFIEFDCNYQILETIRELPIEVIHYLRILCSKKGTLQLNIKKDTLSILFEDTFPSKMSMRERKEKEVDKYVLTIPLKEVGELDRQIVELSYNLVYSSNNKTTPIGQEIPNLPINLTTITCPHKKEPIEYWGTIEHTEVGDFTVVDTSGLLVSLVICPTLISNNSVNNEITEEDTNELLILDSNTREEDE